MLQKALGYLGQAFHPSRNILLWVLLVLSVLLASSNAYRQHTARKAARQDRAAVRAELLDSLRRAGELQARSVRRGIDTALTRRAGWQQAKAEQLRAIDQAHEERYRANRFFLPAL